MQSPLAPHPAPFLTYPGTNIRVIRGGAPEPGEQPAGGDPAAKGGAPAKAEAAGGGGGKADAGGGEDYRAKYDELKTQYDRYEKIGKPEQIEQVVTDWRSKSAQLQKIEQDFKDGKITLAEAKAEARQVDNADPWDGYDDLEPRKQGERLLGILQKDNSDFTKKELQSIRDEVKTLSSNLSTQMKLAWKLMTLARSNPDMDIDAIIQQSTEASAYTPEQIIDLIAEKQASPKKMQQQIDAALAKQKAELTAEFENRKAPPLTRPAPRLMPKEKTGTLAERKNKVFGNFMDRMNAASERSA